MKIAKQQESFLLTPMDIAILSIDVVKRGRQNKQY